MIRLYDELTDLEKMALVDISYSRLSMFDTCAAKYFYGYILQEERQFGPAAAMGQAIHSALETTDFSEPFSLYDLHRSFEAGIVTHDPEAKVPAQLIDAGYEMLTEFVDRHRGDMFNVIASELAFKLVIGSALLSGYIDRVDRDSDGIKVVDYKSGKSEVAQKNISQDLQLGIYALVCSKLFPGEPIHAYLYYLRSGKLKGHSFSPEDLCQVEARVLSLVERLIDAANFAPTQDRSACRICDFAKPELCNVGAQRLKSMKR